MEHVYSIFFFLLGVICTAYLIYFIPFVFGFHLKSNVMKITGYLEKVEVQKNVFIGHPFTGKWHKCMSRCTYIYRIEDREYRVSCRVPGQRKKAPMKTTVVVQRCRPQFSYVPEFDRAPPTSLVFFLLAGCVFFYLFGFLAWGI